MSPLYSLFGISHGNVEPTMGQTRSSGDTARAASKADRAERSVKMLEDNLTKTLLICEALWELLMERSGLTVEDLHKKLYEIDMRDGALDGKNQRKSVECHNCGRMVGSRHSTCLYCGQVIDDSVFRI